MSDDNNTNVVSSENGQTDKAKAMKRRSSFGRFFDGVKSLLGFSTGDADVIDNKDADVEDENVKQEVDEEDQMDVEEDNSEFDPLAEEVDSIEDAERDDFWDEEEDLHPDPERERIKKMNLSKKEKIALVKQRR
jgi:hypothetical protein